MQHNSQFIHLVQQAKQQIETCEIQDIKTMLDQDTFDGVLIDTREDSEAAIEMLPQAMHLSKGMIECKIESLILDPSTKIYLYCGGGSRSALAAKSLKEMGYQQAISINGGFRAWKEAGYPTVSGADK